MTRQFPPNNRITLKSIMREMTRRFYTRAIIVVVRILSHARRIRVEVMAVTERSGNLLGRTIIKHFA